MLPRDPPAHYILPAANYPAFLKGNCTPAPVGFCMNYHEGNTYPISSPTPTMPKTLRDRVHRPLLGKPSRMHPTDLWSCLAPSAFGGPSAIYCDLFASLSSSADTQLLKGRDSPFLTLVPQVWLGAHDAQAQSAGRGRKENRLLQRTRSALCLASLYGSAEAAGTAGRLALTAAGPRATAIYPRASQQLGLSR